MKRPTDDDTAEALSAVTLTVRGRYLRVPDVGSWERKAAPKSKPLEVSAMGFVADKADEWAAVRINRGRMSVQAARDRALLMTTDTMYSELLQEAATLTLRAPLPEHLDPGYLAENLFCSGTATAKTLCVGDVLAVTKAHKRRRGATDEGGGLVLQVASPCQPCHKVDERLGKTKNGGGVRAHAARTGLRGWFLRVLTPGTLREGDAFAVVERPNPAWPLSRVADLIYNIDGVCDGPQYVWPTTGAEVAAKFRGTREELRELASLPELADFEWGEEAKKMLVAWEAAERNKACAIL